jgi:hypothetical protein
MLNGRNENNPFDSKPIVKNKKDSALMFVFVLPELKLKPKVTVKVAEKKIKLPKLITKVFGVDEK